MVRSYIASSSVEYCLKLGDISYQISRTPPFSYMMGDCRRMVAKSIRRTENARADSDSSGFS